MATGRGPTDYAEPSTLDGGVGRSDVEMRGGDDTGPRHGQRAYRTVWRVVPSVRVDLLHDLFGHGDRVPALLAGYPGGPALTDALEEVIELQPECVDRVGLDLFRGKMLVQ